MGSNRPEAKFHLKSDSNLRLIKFLDPKKVAGLTCCDDTIQIQTINSILNLNLIKIISKLIENVQIQSKMSKSIKNSVVFELFRSNLRYF